MAGFNTYANPKVETKRFKIYADIGTTDTPEWELQGRGVESWSIEQNEDVTKTPDVLGFIDMERGTSQPTQSGVSVRLRKGSKFGEMLFNAWYTNDKSSLDAIKMLLKFEFVDGATEGTCLARLEEDVMINIGSFEGEAGGYLGFTIDIHYANKSTTGTMLKEDGENIEFIPDSAA